MQRKQKKNNGISLIILIITIIIMMILAATTIVLLNDAKILSSAAKAIKENDISNAKEIVVMARTDWRTNDIQILEEGYTTFKSYAEDTLREYGFQIGKNAGQLEVSETGQLYEYKKPIIPNGFVGSSVETEDEVSEGFVIYQGSEVVTEENVEVAKETRNQFVWVPVPNLNEFIYREGYSNGILQSYFIMGDVSEPCLSSSVPISEINDITGEYAEYNAMKQSVEKYGGFYVGRYETGTTVSRTNISNSTSFKVDKITPDILIQKNKSVYNYVGWAPSMATINGEIVDSNFNQGYGAVVLSRGLISSDAKCHLIYGLQWDATMKFIEDRADIKDSRKWGNYIDYNESVDETNKVEGAGTLQNTGYSENWMCKNIYDLAGNVSEWTMEAFHGEFTR